MALFKITSLSPLDLYKLANFSKIGLSRFRNDLRLRCPKFKSLLFIKNGDAVFDETGFMIDKRFVVHAIVVAFPTTVVTSAESSAADVRSTTYILIGNLSYEPFVRNQVIAKTCHTKSASFCCCCFNSCSRSYRIRRHSASFSSSLLGSNSGSWSLLKGRSSNKSPLFKCFHRNFRSRSCPLSSSSMKRSVNIRMSRASSSICSRLYQINQK